MGCDCPEPEPPTPACLEKIASIVAILSSCLSQTVDGQTIAQLGDSVGSAPQHRISSDDATWIGDTTWNNSGQFPLTFARSGWTYSNMLNGVGAISGLIGNVNDPQYPAPDYVYILGGYNDVAQAPDDSDMLDSIMVLEDMLDTIDTGWNSPTVFLSNITNFDPQGNFGNKISNVSTLNTLIEMLASSNPNVHLVDNNAIVIVADLASDGLHVDSAGLVTMGQSFAEQFEATVVKNCLLSDVNLNGELDFLDIPMLVKLLRAGDFQYDADCNQNGEVKFYDISPLISTESDAN